MSSHGLLKTSAKSKSCAKPKLMALAGIRLIINYNFTDKQSFAGMINCIIVNCIKQFGAMDFPLNNHAKDRKTALRMKSVYTEIRE